MIDSLLGMSSINSEVVTRAQTGDKASLDSIIAYLTISFRIHIENILPFQYHSWTEDIVQNSLIKVIKGLYQYDSSKARLVTWSYTIADNTITDFLRGQIRSYNHTHGPLLSLDDPILQKDGSTNVREIPVPDNGQDIDHYLRNIYEKHIKTAVKKMSHVQYRAFMLYTVHDMQYNEIAAAENVAEGTVKSRVSRARDCLRHEIQLAILKTKTYPTASMLMSIIEELGDNPPYVGTERGMMH